MHDTSMITDAKTRHRRETIAAIGNDARFGKENSIHEKPEKPHWPAPLRPSSTLPRQVQHWLQAS